MRVRVCVSVCVCVVCVVYLLKEILRTVMWLTMMNQPLGMLSGLCMFFSCKTVFFSERAHLVPDSLMFMLTPKI